MNRLTKHGVRAAAALAAAFALAAGVLPAGAAVTDIAVPQRDTGTRFVHRIITGSSHPGKALGFGQDGVLGALDVITPEELTAALAAYQGLDADLTDLADGSLTGSKVGTGINASNITSGTLASARLPAAGIFTTGIRIGADGVAMDYIAPGVMEIANLGPGDPEGLRLDMNTVVNTGVFSTTSGLATLRFDGINLQVPTEAYDAGGWNGDYTVPTKDAVRDKLESMGGSGDTREVLAVRNDTGSTIVKGAAVYLSGESGGLFQIAPADADGELTARVAGLVQADIAHGATGTLVRGGLFQAADTLGFTFGDPLYLSATAGEYLTTAPAPPAWTVPLGTVGLMDDEAGEINLHIGYPTRGSAVFTKLLTADTSAYSSTTLQDATGLTHAVAAGKTYWFRATVTFTSSGTTKGIKLAVNGPAASNVAVRGRVDISTSAQALKRMTAWDSTIDGSLGPGSSNQWQGELEGYFTTTSAGTFAVRWACFDAGVSQTLLMPSVLMIKEVL